MYPGISLGTIGRRVQRVGGLSGTNVLGPGAAPDSQNWKKALALALGLVNQPVVDATWFVHSDITSNLNLNLGVAWSAAMEVNAFTNAAAYISHYTGGSWDATATAAATAQGGGMFSIQRTGLTSLSPFAVFNQNTSTNIEEVKAVQFEVWQKAHGEAPESVRCEAGRAMGHYKHTPRAPAVRAPVSAEPVIRTMSA